MFYKIFYHEITMKLKKIQTMEITLGESDLIAGANPSTILIKIGKNIYEARRPLEDGFCYDVSGEPVLGNVIAKYWAPVSKHPEILWRKYQKGDELHIIETE
jgi:hypothetical protein